MTIPVDLTPLYYIDGITFVYTYDGAMTTNIYQHRSIYM